jgi:hypothetical protein
MFREILNKNDHFIKRLVPEMAAQCCFRMVGTAFLNTVAYLRKARTAEPEKQPFLGNGCVTQQWTKCWKRCFCAIRADVI